MMDEKKIEEAADKFAQLERIYFNEYYPMKNGFKAGINWFNENLWHDASEVPDRVEEILLEQEFNGKKQHQAYMFYSASFYREHCRECGVTRWLYIDDLMKGGK